MKRNTLLTWCLVIAIAALMVVGATIFAFDRRADAPYSSQPDTPARQVQMDGTFTCLPHRGVEPGQPQTLECAFGMHANDGYFYALQGLQPTDMQTGVGAPITVTGLLSPSNNNEPYDISGTILVDTLTVH